MKTRNSTQLKRRMEGHWLSAFRALAPALDFAIEKLGRNVPCPLEGGTDGFRLFKDANETGGGVKQSWRVIPEGIDMLMWVNNWDYPKVYDELEAWLGEKPIDRGMQNHHHHRKSLDESGLRVWLNQIWNEALALPDPKAQPGRLYFYHRGMFQAAMSATDIRFHPQLNYKDEQGNSLGHYGSVLALIRNNSGEPVAIHRTYLTKGGYKLRLGSNLNSKKMTPSVNQRSKGRHVRLFAPQNGYLGVCEGLETALAVYQAKQFPVWPGLSATMLPSFVPPQGVHTVLNFVDKDRSHAGENASILLEDRLAARGIQVFNLLPPTPILSSDEKGIDWADQLERDVSGFDLIDRATSYFWRKQA